MQIVRFYKLIGKRRPNLTAIAGKLKRAGFERREASGRLIAMAKADRIIIIDDKGNAACSDCCEPDKEGRLQKNMDNMMRNLPHSLGVKDVDVAVSEQPGNASFSRILASSATARRH